MLTILIKHLNLKAKNCKKHLIKKPIKALSFIANENKKLQESSVSIITVMTIANYHRFQAINLVQ